MISPSYKGEPRCQGRLSSRARCGLDVPDIIFFQQKDIVKNIKETSDKNIEKLTKGGRKATEAPARVKRCWG